MTGESEVRDGYTRLDNGFWADARICRLRDEMPRAALIYVMALSWCSCNLTDGDIDTDQLTYTLGASEQEIETLIDIGLFQQTITGVRINEYQSNGNHTRKELADRQASDDKYSADFETFWKAYPRHVDKRPAWKAWKNAIQDTGADTIINSARAYARQVEIEGTEPKYVKYAATWLNAAGWENEYDIRPTLTLRTSTLKCTCTVILAVCSREYRNKYTRFCNFVLAYIDAVCTIKLLISVSCLFIILRRNCLKYFFQSTFPCIFSFVYSDHCISIGEVTVSSYFTDHCISDGKLTNLTIRNFQDNIAKSRCKEISRIKVMLNLYAHAITKCHLCNCSCNTMAVKCISRNNFAVLHIFMKFFILIHDSCIIRQIILILRCAKPYHLFLISS